VLTADFARARALSIARALPSHLQLVLGLDDVKAGARLVRAEQRVKAAAHAAREALRTTCSRAAG